MKYRRLSIFILVLFLINWFGLMVYSKNQMYLNFDQIRFFYSEKMNRYIICAKATDDSTDCGKLKWDNIYMIVEDSRDRKIMIDNDKIEVSCISKKNGLSKKSAPLGRLNIIIDNSGSLDDERWESIQKKVVDFINEMPDGFEVQVIKFSDNIQVKSGFSSDKQFLIKQLKSTYPRGSCALWDAIEYGVQELMSGWDTYPFLCEIVLTSGRDTGSKISMEEIKSRLIPKCEGNLLLILLTDLSDSTETIFSAGINSPIFYSKKISDIPIEEDTVSLSSPVKALEMRLDFLSRIMRVGMEDLYVFRFPAVSEFDDIKAVYLVKKARDGTVETIQDFYIQPFDFENVFSFWILPDLNRLFQKFFEDLNAKLPTPPEMQKTFITHLSFIDALSQSKMVDMELSALLDEAVLYGMKEAKRENSTLYINETSHSIANTDSNVSHLVNITFNPNLTKTEKIDQIISDMMTPNGVDVIVTGHYVDDVKNPLISIRPFIILKWNQKLIIKNLQFTRADLLCRNPENGKRILCKNAFDEIATAVQELLEQL